MKMKRFHALVAVLAMSAPLFAQQGESIQALYDEGRALYNAGHFEQAREKLSIVAARNPSHVPTRAMLAQIQQQLGAAPAVTMKNSYEKVIIPKIEMDNVSLLEAIEAVRVFTRKATEDKVTPNIILKSPELKDRKVSLNLSQMPLTEILNYIAQMVDAKLTYDKHAVMIVAKEGS